MFLGHHRDCIVRKICRAKVKKAKAKSDLIAAELRLAHLLGEYDSDRKALKAELAKLG